MSEKFGHLRKYKISGEPLVVRSTLLEGSIPPYEARHRQEPVFGSLPKDWQNIKILQPVIPNSAEKCSAELVIDSYIRVGDPGSYLRAKILVDSGSRVPILFRQNFIQNLVPAAHKIKMCTVSHHPLPGGDRGAVLSMALPISCPKSSGELVEKTFRLQDWGYEGAIGGGGWTLLWAIQSW